MVDNPKVSGQVDFQAVLYYNFRVRNPRLYKVADVALEMGIKPDTLDAYISGELSFPIGRLPALVRATHDEEYLNFLCDESGFFPCRKPSVEDAEMMTPHDFFFEAIRHMTDAIQDLKNDGDYVKQRRSLSHLDKAIGLLFVLKSWAKKAMGK